MKPRSFLQIVRFAALVAVLIVPMMAITSFATAQEGPPQVGLHPLAEGYAVHGPYWVGATEFVIDPDSERPIPLWVWYPALNPDGAEEAITYEIQVKWTPAPDFPTVVYGHALRDAAPALSGGPYPVLVLSPGWGTPPAFYANLVEHTASYGFVVLSPDHLEHVDLMTGDLFKDLPRNTVENPRDITRVLDYAEGLTASGGALEGLLDLERVAVAGHSSGGYTALAAGGARLDLAAFNARCEAARAQGDPNAWLCDPLEPFEAEIAAQAGLDSVPEGLWPSWAEPRVDAIIAMASDSYLFGEAGLAEITVPMMAMGGTADTGTPPEWGILPAFEYASSQHKALVLFENAEHAIFANSCASAPWLVEIGMDFFCTDPNWDLLHSNDLINHFMTAFLLATLKGDADATAALAPDAVAFPGITYQAQGFLGRPALAAEEILGTWRLRWDTFHFQFRADGTFRANQSRAGLDTDSPEDLGAFAVENGVLTLTSAETTRYCKPGEVGTYGIYFTAQGELAFLLRQDECSMREAPPGKPQVFNRVD